MIGTISKELHRLAKDAALLAARLAKADPPEDLTAAKAMVEAAKINGPLAKLRDLLDGRGKVK
jgi:hypothetical protein